MPVLPGPMFFLAEILGRLAGEPTLAVLHSCGSGWTHLAWGMPQRRFASWREACSWLKTGGVAPDISGFAAGGWGRFPGGAFIQVDYEFPEKPGFFWPVESWVSWDPQGRCTLNAADQAGLDRLREGLSRSETPLPQPALAGRLTGVWDAAGHRRRIERIHDYIVAGDIYQANLTMPFRGWLAPGDHRDLALFLALTGQSPAPFSAFFRGGDAGGRAPEAGNRSVISHSPECFLKLRGDRVASEPIKGTVRRVPSREAEIRAALLASAKDRAELAMIVDLVRNDLGRTAVPGSVVVAEPARVMDLPHVHHLVARVEARLRSDQTTADTIAAAFPAGSITGAPKIRAMQIIRELESGPRGPYCGVFGWLGANGDADLAVAIRTLAVTGDEVRLDAGGGIVADSDPAAEWDELRAKASAMARVLGMDL